MYSEDDTDYGSYTDCDKHYLDQNKNSIYEESPIPWRNDPTYDYEMWWRKNKVKKIETRFFFSTIQLQR